MMARNGGPLHSHLRDLAQACVEMADAVTPDPDLEPDADAELAAVERHGQGFMAAGGLPDDAEDNGDGEPSLGASACAPRATVYGLSDVYPDRTSSQLRWGEGSRSDREGDEHDGREPSLCGLTVGSGDDGDREGEHDGVEPDPDDAEPWHGPPRLDVFAEPLPASPDFLPTPVIERHTRD